MHTLDIDIADTNNIATFRVTDNSSIDCNIPVSDGLLQVWVPGFVDGIIMRVEPKFQVVFNCANLKLSAPDTCPLPPLPDGVYRVHYSVAPNMYLYIDYMYFRVSKLLSDYNNKLFTLYKGKCNMNSLEFEERRLQLDAIKDRILAAKFAVEDKHDLRMGNDLYSEAKSLLAKC